MAKTAPLSVQVNGATYTVAVDAKSGKTVVFVNGQPAAEHKNNSLSWAIGVNEDIPVMIDNMQFIVALRKNKARLVANGAYIDNNEAFEPAVPAPGWLLVFIILCFIEAIGSIVFIGGVLGMAIGFIGLAICSAIGGSKMQTGAKLALCIGTTMAVYALWYFLSAAVLAVLY